MVAARAANQTGDVRPTAGSLLLAPREIEDTRWRLDAYARIGPALHRCGIPLDRLRALLREGMRGAVCPAPLRPGLEQLVLDHVERDRIAAFAIAALWTRDWTTAGFRATAAHIAARDLRRASMNGKSHATAVLERNGVVDGEFIGDLRDAEAFTPTVPLVAALVEAGDPRAEAIAAGVKEREPAQAHIARLRGDARGLSTPRGRSGAWLWIARDLLADDQFDAARAIGERIEMPMVRQYARLELARALVERGRISDGLVELRQIIDPRLANERRVLFEEVRLAASHPHTPLPGRDPHGPSWQPQAWMLPAGALDVNQRSRIRIGVYFLRGAVRLYDHYVTTTAANCLHDVVDHPAARRAALDLAHRLGVDLERGLRAIRRMHRGVAAFAADHIAILGEQLRVDPMPVAPPNDDATSLDRSLYDERVALTQPARRRVLIGVAQHALRASLVDPERWPYEAILVRLRTLALLGGKLSSDAIAIALRTLPFRRAVMREALVVLAQLDPRTAAQIALDNIQRLHRPFDLVHAIELYGGFPAGYARTLSKLENRWMSREWILELVATWRARMGTAPSVELLRRIGTHPQPIGELLDRIQQAPAAMRGIEDHVSAAHELATKDDLLEGFEICEPPRVDVTMRPWSSNRMRALVQHATSKWIGAITPGLVARIAKRLKPAALEPVQAFVVQGVRYQVRYLDKRTDLLTYLRFTDTPARSCYRSDQGWYYRHSRVELLRAWKDPLTVAFHVERERRGEMQVCGFLFGNFADVDGQLGLVFNSLHSRPSSAAVREHVLRSVERIVAPFGILQIGIANVHGGSGVLPADYAQRSVTLIRYRALALRGQLIRSGWDDLPKPNTRLLSTALYWRALQQPDSTPARPSAS